MNVLVLGGCGFIGSHVVDELCRGGHTVTVFDKNEPRYRNEAARYITGYDDGNWNNAKAIVEAMRGQDTAIHLIGSPANANGDAIADIITNVSPSVRLFEICAQTGVKQVVFASSGGAVYGDVRNMPIYEDCTPQPISVNGVSKVTIEAYLRLACQQGDMGYTILRIANPYGERQSPTCGVGAIAAFAYSLLRNKPVQIYGSGDVVRDYVYVGDVVRAFRLAVDKQALGTFNVGTGIGTSLTELVNTIAPMTGITMAAAEYWPPRHYDVPKNILDNRLARMTLDWQPETSLADGIAKTVEWIREHYQFSK